MPLPSELQINVVSSIDDVLAMRTWLGERRDILGLDIETSGLDAFKPGARIRMVQIGDKKSGWAVPWEGWGGAVMECLNTWEGNIALHNSAFDLKFLQKHANWDVPWNRIHDTMLMSQIMRPGQPAGLKELTSKFVDPNANIGEKYLKKAFKDNGWDWDTVPIDYPAYANYSALDPVITVYLWDYLRADRAYPKVFDMEMEVRRICTEMEYRGMRLDLDYCVDMENKLHKEVEQRKKWAVDNWGINISSNAQLAEFFSDTLGAEFSYFTATGAPSVNKAQLAEFKSSGDPQITAVVDFVEDVKYKAKLANTYFKNYREMAVDGIIHPSINTLGTATGRMSSSNPNMQNLPSKDYYVRDAFIPLEDDHEIWSIDYSSMELRQMGNYAKDPGLKHAFELVDNEGQDFFVTLGKAIYDEPDFQKSDKRRKLLKSMTYGLIYGASPAKMAQTSGASEEVMKNTRDKFFDQYPKVQELMEGIIQLGDQRENTEGQAYITFPTTGRRVPTDSNTSYRLVNYLLQGTSAEVTKNALINLDQAGLTQYALLPIHDEVVFSFPKDYSEELVQTAVDAMSFGVEDGYDIPQVAEAELAGDRWGQKYH